MCSPLCMVPPVPLMRLALRENGALFDAGEHYVKQSFRNRYHILTAQGVKAMSIPMVHTGGVHVASAKIKIDHSGPWLRDHIRTLRAAYGSSPFFIHYIDAVEDILSTPAKTLGDFFSQNFEKWCKLLKVEIRYEVAPEFAEGSYRFDLRGKLKNPASFPEEGTPPPYPQVFDDRHPFAANLSVIDLLFNEGPAAAGVLTT